MAQQSVLIPISNQVMPFFPDLEYPGVLFSGRSEKSVPLMYISNVVPTAYGFRSLQTKEFISVAAPAAPSPYKSRGLTLVESVTGQEGWYYAAGVGTLTHRVWYNGSWVSAFTSTDAAATRKVTHAKVNGVYYNFTAIDGIFGFASGFASKVAYTPTGITPALMQGISNALDYLITYDFDTIYWSAPGSAMEFRPVVSDISTGAGSTKIQELRGEIVDVFPIAGGALIYTTENVVAMRYSGNSRNPWIFSEVRGAGGVYDLQSVVGRGSSAPSHFAYTKSGVQEINLTQATSVLPELADFLASKSTYTESLGFVVPSQIAIESKICSICFVSNRYLCISISNTGFATPTVFQSVIVYDILYKAWGKIDIDHVGAFDFSSESDPLKDKTGVLALWTSDLKVSLCLLGEEGNNISDWTKRVGTILLGKFKFSQGSVSTINEFTLSGTANTDTSAAMLVSQSYPNSPRTRSTVSFTQIIGQPLYIGQITGEDFVVRLQGIFSFSGLVTKIVRRGNM